jgi:hypothetical protein
MDIDSLYVKTKRGRGLLKIQFVHIYMYIFGRDDH